MKREFPSLGCRFLLTVKDIKLLHTVNSIANMLMKPTYNGLLYCFDDERITKSQIISNVGNVLLPSNYTNIEVQNNNSQFMHFSLGAFP